MSTAVTVLKVGGSTLGSADSTVDDVVRLQSEGERIVIVHGGGSEITRRLDEAGIKGEFVDGLRATNHEAMPVVIAALDDVNARLTASLTDAGAESRRFPSTDCVLVARRVPALGRVGDVSRVLIDGVCAAIDAGSIAVVAPLARDTEDGQLLNVNGDTAAGEIAIALSARRLVFATDVPGVQTRDGELLPLLHIDDAAVLIADGTAVGGMAPKLRACMKAAAEGIECVILDGRELGAVYRLVCEGQVEGTRVGPRALA